MPKPYLSRLFLGSQASVLASLNFPPAGQADEFGETIVHNVLALAGWNEDEHAHLLNLVDLAVRYKGTDILGAPSLQNLSSFRLLSAPHSLAVTELETSASSQLAVVACADGTLCRLRLTLPVSPGSDPTEIQLKEADFDGDALLPWLKPHHGPAVVDVAGPHVLSAGADGSLAVHNIEKNASDVLLASPGALSFTACRWNGPHTCLTASLQSTLQLWDTRASNIGRTNAKPAASRVLASREPILSLDAHPAEPHACASGDAGGTLATWDLRGSSTSPVTQLRADGAINALLYSPQQQQQLLLATDRGAVATAVSERVHVLYQEPGVAVEGLALSTSGAGTRVFASTAQEVLLFAANLPI